METDRHVGHDVPHLNPAPPPRKSSPGLLGRLPFMRTPSNGTDGEHDDDDDNNAPSAPQNTESLPTTVQAQVRTRRRRGSLRKVALLGRSKPSSGTMAVDMPAAPTSSDDGSANNTTPKALDHYDALGLGTDDLTPRASTGDAARRSNMTTSFLSSSNNAAQPSEPREAWAAYNSTTDEDDVIQLPGPSSRRMSQPTMPSGPSSYYAEIGIASAQRRRSFHQAKSPLSSYNGLPATSGQPDPGWNYSETEWWGWVVLVATWLVFVIGMGSCLDVWSWAWDVGKTPYAPPELEDDPTLPIVGYYPCLIILTGVMAWVWVVVAWVGMKHFRHAKISGD